MRQRLIYLIHFLFAIGELSQYNLWKISCFTLCSVVSSLSSVYMCVGFWGSSILFHWLIFLIWCYFHAINKAIFEHSHGHPLMYFFMAYFGTASAKLNSWDRDNIAQQNLHIHHLALYGKRLLTLVLTYTIRFFFKWNNILKLVRKKCNIIVYSGSPIKSVKRKVLALMTKFSKMQDYRQLQKINTFL